MNNSVPACHEHRYSHGSVAIISMPRATIGNSLYHLCHIILAVRSHLYLSLALAVRSLDVRLHFSTGAREPFWHATRQSHEVFGTICKGEEQALGRIIPSCNMCSNSFLVIWSRSGARHLGRAETGRRSYLYHLVCQFRELV